MRLHPPPHVAVSGRGSEYLYSGDPSSVTLYVCTQCMSICCFYGNKCTCCASPSCLKLTSVAPSAWQAASASLKFIAYLPCGERRWKTPAVLAEHNNRYFHLRLLLFRNKLNRTEATTQRNKVSNSSLSLVVCWVCSPHEKQKLSVYQAMITSIAL